MATNGVTHESDFKLTGIQIWDSRKVNLHLLKAVNCQWVATTLISTLPSHWSVTQKLEGKSRILFVTSCPIGVERQHIMIGFMDYESEILLQLYGKVMHEWHGDCSITLFDDDHQLSLCICYLSIKSSLSMHCISK